MIARQRFPNRRYSARPSSSKPAACATPQPFPGLPTAQSACSCATTSPIRNPGAAITFSIAVQHGADPEVIRRALCRDSQGNASGPLAKALDLLAQDEQ